MQTKRVDCTCNIGMNILLVERIGLSGVGRGGFALCLSFVLEPYRYRLDFPKERVSEFKGEHTWNTNIPPALARASLSSRDGCEF